MKFKMIMLVMALSAVCMTACGKAEEKKVESAAPESSEIQGESGNAEVESMAPGSYEIQDEGGNATLYIPEEDAEEEEEEAIGDVDIPGDSFGRLTMDCMMEYSVGTAGDMIVPVSSRDTTVEDVVADLTVMFPMKPYYEGEIESGNSYTQFIASNGDYNYQMAFNTIPTKGLKQTAEDEGGILYEETDNYIFDVQHGNTDANEEVKYGGAKINIYNKTTGVRLEIMLTCGMEEGAAEGTGARFGEFDEWVRANVDLIKSKLN
jgi:hypothetical protein